MSQKITTLCGKTIDEWTFRKADTQYLTHGLHPYPARMIPQLANKLILRYSEEKDWVLDPFCGSGTVLVECRLNKRHSIGNEINPLAVLLSKVKTTPLTSRDLKQISKRVLNEVEERIRRFRNKHSKTKFVSMDRWIGKDTHIEIDTSEIEISKFPNIDLWFKENVAYELSILRNTILNLDCGQKYIDFFRVCLSFTAMKSSNADFESHQAHPSRYKPERLKTHSPDILSIFRRKVIDSMERIINFSKLVSENKFACFVLFGDAKQLDLEDMMPSRGVNLIVTSPPYGEEQNTIGYHRWSRIMAYWIGFSQDEIKRSQKVTLGARPHMDVIIPSKTAVLSVDLVKQKSEGSKRKTRAANLASFFHDYNKSIHQMAEWLNSKGTAAIVVGNRQVLGHRIAMDRVTVELAEQVGLKEHKTFYRDIPNTVMPKRIPEGETIARESIMILKKT